MFGWIPRFGQLALAFFCKMGIFTRYGALIKPTVAKIMPEAGGLYLTKSKSKCINQLNADKTGKYYPIL